MQYRVSCKQHLLLWSGCRSRTLRHFRRWYLCKKYS